MQRLVLNCITLMAIITLASCATGDGSSPANLPLDSRINSCRGGDQSVSSAAQCLRDDAACYQIADGTWCTGDRSNTCPAGSIAIPAGTACPAGARCFQHSESTHCAISLR